MLWLAAGLPRIYDLLSDDVKADKAGALTILLFATDEFLTYQSLPDLPPVI